MCNTCPKPLKIEAGKYYRLRNGKKAFVSAVLLPPPFGIGNYWESVGQIAQHDTLSYWYKGGRKIHESRESLFDIIEEWREPVTKEGVVYLRRRKGHPDDMWLSTGNHMDDLADTIGSVKVKLVEGQFAS